MELFAHTFLLLLAIIISVATASNNAVEDDDEVTYIPNYKGEAFCWKHYAGYLPASNDHNLFYWYHEATSDPDNKPLVLWLNGGPGCSSLGGMFTELGPFVLDSGLDVTLNPFSFNKVANIIFIEQPAGVGFSYPNVPANDTTTAIDTVMALRYFLKEKQPDLQGRDFYIMGESYGGHYVPNTAKQIQVSNLEAKAKGEDGMVINLKGFAVGNGYTDWQLDFNANVENGRFHALTSQARFSAAKTACSGDYARCFWPRPDVECPEACADAVQDAVMDSMDGSIDIYDIYEDVCLTEGQARIETQTSVLLRERRNRLLEMRLQLEMEQGNGADASAPGSIRASHDENYRTEKERRLRAVISPVFPTCIDASSEKYLNLPEVQNAIHVRPGKVAKWADCGNVRYDFNYESELPNYLEWTKKGELEMLIYNGDTDYILSHMGNSAWINDGLGLTKGREWSKWRGSDGQVAGYFETYETGKDGKGAPLTFLTVKGAGHMVPRDRPQHALDMFEKFLAGDGSYDKVKRIKVEPLCPTKENEL